MFKSAEACAIRKYQYKIYDVSVTVKNTESIKSLFLCFVAYVFVRLSHKSNQSVQLYIEIIF